MNENYLPVKESLGYKNVKKALWNVFKIDLDTIEISTGKYEGFGFYLNYNNISAYLGIYDTGKNQSFQAGEGGIFSISFLNPDYPKNSLFKTISFSSLIDDKNIGKKLRWCLGKNEQDIGYAMSILKDFLRSDKAKVLINKSENVSNSKDYLKLKEILESNISTTTIDHWEIETQQLNLYVIDSVPWDKLIEYEHILTLRVKLDNYLNFIKSKQYIKICGTNFTKINFGVALKYKPTEAAIDFLNKTKKNLANEGISLEIILDE
nr:DUF6572 domain-containing protein [Streptococcus lutetiensis]